MKLFIIMILGLISNMAHARYSESFLVEINDQRIRVTSPKKKSRYISVIIKNETFDKIVSELKLDKKVLKRFTLRPQKKEVIQVDMKTVKNMYFVPLSPPFEAVELKIKERPYEVPEKK